MVVQPEFLVVSQFENLTPSVPGPTVQQYRLSLVSLQLPKGDSPKWQCHVVPNVRRRTFLNPKTPHWGLFSFTAPTVAPL